MQYVDKNRKSKQASQPDKVDNRFDFAVERFFAYPLDNAKNHFTAVKRRHGQKVKHRQIHADQRCNIQERGKTARRRLCGYGNGRYRSAHCFNAELARQQFAQRAKYAPAELKGIYERIAYRLEKSVADSFRIERARAYRFYFSVRFLVHHKPQRIENGRGVRHILEICVRI